MANWRWRRLGMSNQEADLAGAMVKFEGETWHLMPNLRWKNGRLQQPWVRVFDGVLEWRDVPEADEE